LSKTQFFMLFRYISGLFLLLGIFYSLAFEGNLFAESAIAKVEDSYDEKQFIDYEKQTFCGYPIIQYETLDFMQLEIRKIADKVCLERFVYYDPISTMYVKVWLSNFSRNRTFIRALALDYYKDLAPISGIILDGNGTCRGYVTHSLDHANLSLALCLNKHKYTCLQEAAKQNYAYKKFYQQLIQRSEETLLYYLDFVPGNIVMDHTSYYLVDLESVYSIEELRRLRSIRYEEYRLILEHLPPDYASFIELAILKKERP